MGAAVEIRKLIDYLNARTKEYDEGHPTISDEEWDRQYFKLHEYEMINEIFFNDSPTQSISYEVVNSLEKVAHNHDMLSLEKTKALDVIKGFLGNVPYLAMCKMDGLTCSLKYDGGFLVSAETRGTGQVGENILHNAKVIPNIPKQIPYKDTLIVDGEIICSYYDFEDFKDEYKNPRNFASGSIRLLDSNECAKRKLQFVAWEVIEGFIGVDTLSEKLMYLQKNGFTVVPNYTGSEANVSIEDLIDLVNCLVESARVASYPIDGIVFKFDDVEYGKTLGKTSHHFKNAMAYKFADEEYETRLLDIEWSMGRTGQLSPIAVFEPLDIDGTEISRASLSNVSIMEKTLGKNPFKGQLVYVTKRNQIIPKIEKAKDEKGEWI